MGKGAVIKTTKIIERKCSGQAWKDQRNKHSSPGYIKSKEEMGILEKKYYNDRVHRTVFSRAMKEIIYNTRTHYTKIWSKSSNSQDSKIGNVT